MARIDIRTGIIGPRHDPYGTMEITFTTTAGRVVSFYRNGLGTLRVTEDGIVLASTTHGDEEYDQRLLEDLFEERAGISIDVAQRAYERLQRNALPDPFPEWMVI